MTVWPFLAESVASCMRQRLVKYRVTWSGLHRPQSSTKDFLESGSENLFYRCHQMHPQTKGPEPVPVGKMSIDSSESRLISWLDAWQYSYSPNGICYPTINSTLHPCCIPVLKSCFLLFYSPHWIRAVYIWLLMLTLLELFSDFHVNILNWSSLAVFWMQ